VGETLPIEPGGLRPTSPRDPPGLRGGVEYVAALAQELYEVHILILEKKGWLESSLVRYVQSEPRFYSDVLESNGFEIVWKKEQRELLLKLQREAQALEFFQLE